MKLLKVITIFICTLNIYSESSYGSLTQDDKDFITKKFSSFVEKEKLHNDDYRAEKFLNCLNTKIQNKLKRHIEERNQALLVKAQDYSRRARLIVAGLFFKYDPKLSPTENTEEIYTTALGFDAFLNPLKTDDMVKNFSDSISSNQDSSVKNHLIKCMQLALISREALRFETYTQDLPSIYNQLLTKFQSCKDRRILNSDVYKGMLSSLKEQKDEEAVKDLIYIIKFVNKIRARAQNIAEKITGKKSSFERDANFRTAYISTKGKLETYSACMSVNPKIKLEQVKIPQGNLYYSVIPNSNHIILSPVIYEQNVILFNTLQIPNDASFYDLPKFLINALCGNLDSIFNNLIKQEGI